MYRIRLLGAAPAALLAMLAVVPVQGASNHPLVGRNAPDFALRASSGVNVRLSEQRGQVVMLTFWGSRCSQCRLQLAALSQLHATYSSAGLVTLAVSIDDDAQRARSFIEATPTPFPMLLDPAKGVGRAYDVDNLPTTLLIDRSGAIRQVYRDYKNGAEALYLQELKTLLDE